MDKKDLEAKGYVDGRVDGGSALSGPYTYCAHCHAYRSFDYWGKQGHLVTVCRACGTVPFGEEGTVGFWERMWRRSGHDRHSAY